MTGYWVFALFVLLQLTKQLEQADKEADLELHELKLRIESSKQDKKQLIQETRQLDDQEFRKKQIELEERENIFNRGFT